MMIYDDFGALFIESVNYLI